MPGPKMYNFMWINSRSNQKKKKIHVALASAEASANDAKTNKANILSIKPIDAVILYPSFATPGIVFKGNSIEIVVVAKKGQQEMKPKHVAQQLKICKGLDKAIDHELLFPLAEVDNKVAVKKHDKELDDDPDVINTFVPEDTSSSNFIKGSFAGIIDKSFLKEYVEKRHYTDLYTITIHKAEEVFEAIDKKTYKDPHTGKITKRNYYCDAYFWLEHMVFDHNLTDKGGALITNKDTSSDLAWAFITNHWQNTEIKKSPVIFRQRESGNKGNYISDEFDWENTKPGGTGRADARYTLTWLMNNKKEVHIDRFVEDQCRHDWKIGDQWVRQTGLSDKARWWDNNYGRYRDKATTSPNGNRIIYGCEKIFIPDDYGSHELQDDIAQEVILGLNGINIRESGLFGFNIDTQKDDIDMTRIRYDRPIISYHPVFYYDNNSTVVVKRKKVFNIGHISDLHINSRQHLMAKSTARVIETDATVRDYVNVQREVSPQLGKCVNINSRNAYQLLKRLGADEDVDIICITGDCIEEIFDFYVNNFDASYRVSKIWSDLNFNTTSSGNTNGKYNANVDYIILYSFIADIYDRFSKPIYIVAGHHEAYNGIYGMSPRNDSKRFMAGLCADHNLTYYEAGLVFGPRFSEMQSLGNTPFNRDAYAWFFHVFTPFRDFKIGLPKQTVVGFYWCEEDDFRDGYVAQASDALKSKQCSLYEKEALKKPSNLEGKISYIATGLKEYTQQIPVFMSHFPVVALEYHLQHEYYEKKGHFVGTLLSYKALFDANLGVMNDMKDLFLADLWREESLHLSGNTHRKAMYRLMTRYDGPKIVNFVLNILSKVPVVGAAASILSTIVSIWGGVRDDKVYQITSDDIRETPYAFTDSEREKFLTITPGGLLQKILNIVAVLDKYVPVLSYLTGLDAKSLDGIFENDAKPTLLIVADSAGPLPRHKDGIFFGSASAYPSANIITFKLNMKYDPNVIPQFNPEREFVVDKVRCIQLKQDYCKPRVAVALDLLDLQDFGSIFTKEFPVFEKFEGVLKTSGSGRHIQFTVQLNQQLHKADKIWENIGFTYAYIYYLDGLDFKKATLTLDALDSTDDRYSLTVSDAAEVGLITHLYGKLQYDPNTVLRKVFMSILFYKKTGAKDSYNEFNYDQPWTFEIFVEYKENEKKYIITRQRAVKASADAPSFSERSNAYYVSRNY